MGASLNENELLFVYGQNSQTFPIGPSSIHLREFSASMTVVVSLPLSRKIMPVQLLEYVIAARNVAMNFTELVVVAAGWEFEMETTADVKVVMSECLSDISLCSLIIMPAEFLPNRKIRFEKISQFGSVVMLKSTH